MYEILLSNQFKKDMRAAKRRGYDMSLLNNVVETLAAGQALDAKYRDHSLSGTYSGFRECHITPDWLLIYRIHEQQLLLFLSRTGTHSDLFK